ncbi:hypothetical protein [Metabacillus niabensis]|uniref:Uncharacterized protein n=1 Tax=Metabacillus niabensis TaxID=324854 RepID=A0ABT9Z1I5_9BACI|nr:hypothetical protein [Metabacillus niabensis]MDQ0225697.1 hypothetical protein [Metabacillus niabensis]
MKKRLTMLFLLLSVVIQTVGLAIDFPWEGIIIWSLSVICILAAAYFTKYLPTGKSDK